MKKIFFIWFVFPMLFVTCNQNCRIDKNVEKYYNHAVKTLSKQTTSWDYNWEIDYDTILGMEVFLSMLTERRPTKNSNWHDKLEYLKMEDLDNDIKYWKSWYKDNKCWLTTSSIDKIYARIKKENLYMQVNLVLIPEKYPDKWEDLFQVPNEK